MFRTHSRSQKGLTVARTFKARARALLGRIGMWTLIATMLAATQVVPASASGTAAAASGRPASPTISSTLPEDPIADPSLIPPDSAAAGVRALGAFETTVVGPVPASLDVTSATLTHYYTCTNLKVVDAPPAYPRDSNGVVMMVYPWISRPVYNPVTVSGYALNRWEAYVHTGDRGALNEFILHAAWLRSHMDQYGRIPYQWTYDVHDLYPPWYSAMAQGQAISVLLRAYQKTGVKSYLDAAVLAMRPLRITLLNGGTAWDTGTDLWLEEYPENPPSHVLNGAIYAMFGLQDLVRVTGNATAKSLLARATTTLKNNLYRYERNGAILYCLEGEEYAYGYERLHLLQLRNLALITGDKTFSSVAQRWATQFLECPRPIVKPSSTTAVEPQGLAYYLKGTVQRYYKPGILVITVAEYGKAATSVTGPSLTPNAYHNASYNARMPALTCNAVVTLGAGIRTVPGRATVSIRVTPRVGIGGTLTKDSSGSLVKLTATIRTGQPDAWFRFEELRSGTWQPIDGVHLTGSDKSGTLSWRPGVGRHVVRAAFLGSVTNGPAVTAPMAVTVF